MTRFLTCAGCRNSRVDHFEIQAYVDCRHDCFDPIVLAQPEADKQYVLWPLYMSIVGLLQ
jgi:hypothetical protein